MIEDVAHQDEQPDRYREQQGNGSRVAADLPQDALGRG
jgi:hypothetical protein